MAWLAGKLASDISAEIEILQQPALFICRRDAIDRVHQGGSPESVVETILQWSADAMQGASAPVKPQGKVEAYCMKCKEKRVMLNAHEITMKDGRISVHGDCAVCGSQLFRMGRLTPGYPQTPL